MARAGARGELPRLDDIATDVFGATASRASAQNVAVFGNEPAPVRSPNAPDVTGVGGGGAIYDAIARALMLPVPRNRRHLVVAFTDGIDQASVLTANQLMELARRTEAVLIVARPGPIPRVRAPDGRNGLLWPVDPAAMTEIAELTGGLDAPGTAWPGAASSYLRAFEAILAGFRQSYVLYYEPEGVSPVGWHEVVVSVPSHSGYTIRARRGYVGVVR